MALMKCRECGGTMSEAAPACPHCGRPRGTVRSLPTGRKSGSGRLLLIGLALVVIFSLLVALTDRPGRPVSMTPIPAQDRRPGIRPESILPGHDAVIDRTESVGALLAIDDKAWSEMIAAQVAGNTDHLAEMVAEGRVFPLKNGQRVRVQERGFASARVRAAGDPGPGRSGWIQLEYLKPAR